MIDESATQTPDRPTSRAQPPGRARLCGLLVVVSLLAVACASPAAYGEMSLANPPPGANNFSCRPSANHPDPIVLVHGLGASMGENWGYISPLLTARGYCVFALTYGLDPRFTYAGGVIPIEQSAPELAAFVQKVLAATHGKRVDLVGHSEGTFMPQYYLKFLGGSRYVGRYVAMTPLYAGTQLGGIPMLRDALQPLGLSQPAIDLVGSYCGSCSEFLAGSPMVKKLTQGGAAVPGIRYTTIPTRYDELVIPYTSGRLPAAPNITNHVLQEVCPADLSEHAAEAFDPVVAQIIFNALDPTHQKTVSCSGLPPFAGTPAGGTHGSGAGGRPGTGCPRATGRLGERSLGAVRLGMTRAGVRRALSRSSARQRRHMEVFCLAASGIRVGYASRALLTSLPVRQRPRLQGRVVLALSANSHYSLDGVGPGARLVDLQRRLRTSAPFHIGTNDWYVVRQGRSAAVLKVRKGTIEEVGVAEQRLTEGRRIALAFFLSFT